MKRNFKNSLDICFFTIPFSLRVYTFMKFKGIEIFDIYITYFINFTNAFCGLNVNDRLLQCVTKQNSTILIEKIADVSVGKKKHSYFYGISRYD